MTRPHIVCSILVALLICSTTPAYGQWSGSTDVEGEVYRRGSVGVGTNRPIGKLHVAGGDSDLDVNYYSTGAAVDLGVPLGQNFQIAQWDAASGEMVERLRMNGGGRFGIGSTDPDALLELWEKDASNDLIFSINSGTSALGGRGTPVFRASRSGVVLGNVQGELTNGYELALLGGVSIGSHFSTSPAPADYKLAVSGKVLAEEVKVQLSEQWPDYVFADDYDLMRLATLAAYVKQHRHLPGIPDAVSVAREGVSLGSMQVMQMRKIEELTLYLIEQEQRIAALTERLDALERVSSRAGR